MLVCLIAACQSIDEPKRPTTLYIPADASEIKWLEQYTGTVYYTVFREFPATELLEQIQSYMARQGFSPVTHDLFNQEQENSHTRGWVDFIDRDGSRAFLWVGDWKNGRGDQVRYELRYKVKEGDNDAKRRLRLGAMHIDVIDVMRLLADQQKPSKP